MATGRGYFCRFVGWLHRRCAGERATAEIPPRLREATHNLNNEVMILKGQVFKLGQSMDELTDLVTHMGGDQ